MTDIKLPAQLICYTHEQLDDLHQDISDLFLTLERRHIITEIQSDRIASELNSIFEAHIKKASSLEKGD